MIERRTFLISAMLLACGQARAQAKPWPAGPVKFIVPFVPAGGIDIVARIIAERLSQRLGTAFIVMNRAGAGTIIGTQVVATSPPDGYTFLFTTNNFTINPSLYRKLPYDPRAFAPVCMVARHAFVLLAHPGLGVTSVQELVAAAKARPEKLSYASVGNGSPQHLVMEIFMRSLGIEMVHIPYQGSAPAVTDLLAGTVHVMFNGVSPTLQHVRSGKLRALAVDTRSRLSILPEVPTLLEAGVKESKTGAWSAIFAPQGTPADVVRHLGLTVAEILDEPETKHKLEALGIQPAGMQQQSFATELLAEQAEWAEAIRLTGARAE